MSGFNEKIIKWVKIDNKLNVLREQVKELRDERNDLKDDIYTFAEQNELDRAVINISDGKLRFQQIKQSNPITFKYLKKCLNECLNDDKQVEHLINYIKEKREYKTSYDIRRTFNK